MRWKRFLWLTPLVLLGFLMFVAIGGGIVQQLWNWLLPPLFDWRPITFWQALGLLALCRILFGGLGGRGISSSHRRNMTPEERDRFKHGIRRRFGFGPSAAGTSGPGSDPGQQPGTPEVGAD